MRGVALVVLAATVALAPAAAAEAKKVTKLEPWGAKKRYLAETDLDGRARPQLNPRTKTDHVRKGQWVRVQCQTRGQMAYGSRIWNRVNGLFVPDQLMKTYTDGFLRRAPRCRFSSPPANPTPPRPEFPSKRLPRPRGGYGSYAQSHSMGGGFEGWRFGEIVDQLNTNFNGYFPFDGCGNHIQVGEKCTLQAPGPNGPVKVTHIARNGFALKSLKGHPEGAGRKITFRFKRIKLRPDYFYLDQTYLVVNAWGPVGGLSHLGPLNAETVARHYWGNFASNMKYDFPRCPPGKNWHGNETGCRAYPPGTVPA